MSHGFQRRIPNTERFSLLKPHLRGGALQQHGIQGDGGEHAGFPGAGLGLHDEICKERPRPSGQPRGAPGPAPGPPAHPARSAPAGWPSAAPATADGSRPPPAPPAPAATAAESRSRRGRRAPARPGCGTGPAPPWAPPSWRGGRGSLARAAPKPRRARRAAAARGRRGGRWRRVRLRAGRAGGAREWPGNGPGMARERPEQPGMSAQSRSGPCTHTPNAALSSDSPGAVPSPGQSPQNTRFMSLQKIATKNEQCRIHSTKGECVNVCARYLLPSVGHLF